MKMLVNCILLFFFSFPLHADIVTCVADYNEAVKERNNAKGSYQTAINYQRRAESVSEKKDNKKLYTQSLEWIKVALSNLARAEKQLDKVKYGGCPDSLIENAGSLTSKNFTDRDLYNKMKLSLETKLSLLQ